MEKSSILRWAKENLNTKIPEDHAGELWKGENKPTKMHITFSSDKQGKEPDEDRDKKLVAYASQSVEEAATRSNSLLLDTLKRAWGDELPDTFLTSLDLEGTTKRKLKRHKSKHWRRAKLLKKIQFASSVPSLLTRTRVEDEKIPTALWKGSVRIPERVPIDTLLKTATETIHFDEPEHHRAYEETLYSKDTAEVIKDAYWWFFSKQFGKGDKSYNAPYEKMRERMATCFVRIFQRTHNAYKDAVFDNYYDGISQFIFYAFATAYPDSTHLLNSELRSSLLKTTALWTIGCVPSSLTFSHWASIMDPKNQKKEQVPTDEIDQGNKMIPCEVRRTTVRLSNSVFVATYMKSIGRSDSGSKNHLMVHLTRKKEKSELGKVTTEVHLRMQRELVKKEHAESKKIEDKLNKMREEYATLERDEKEAQLELDQRRLEEIYEARRDKAFIPGLLKKMNL